MSNIYQILIHTSKNKLLHFIMKSGEVEPEKIVGKHKYIIYKFAIKEKHKCFSLIQSNNKIILFYFNQKKRKRNEKLKIECIIEP